MTVLLAAASPPVRVDVPAAAPGWLVLLLVSLLVLLCGICWRLYIDQRHADDDLRALGEWEAIKRALERDRR